MQHALEGIRICDFTGQLAGAGATKWLAAFGAEVIRIEDPVRQGRWDILRGGEPFKLSPGQFKMLRLFLKRAGCTLTCDEIRSAVWGHSHFVTLKDIDEAVGTLQSIIEPDPGNQKFIHRIIDIGYKFKQPEPDGNNPDS